MRSKRPEDLTQASELCARALQLCPIDHKTRQSVVDNMQSITDIKEGAKKAPIPKKDHFRYIPPSDFRTRTAPKSSRTNSGTTRRPQGAPPSFIPAKPSGKTPNPTPSTPSGAQVRAQSQDADQSVRSTTQEHPPSTVSTTKLKALICIPWVLGILGGRLVAVLAGVAVMLIL